MNKGQLGGLAFHFLWIGALVGIAIAFGLVYSTQNGIIPFSLPIICG